MSLIHYPQPKDLQVLIAVVNTGSFSAAAEILGQTPAFVTKRIQQMEALLGVKLLNRSSRGMALTESGQTAYAHSLEIMDRLQKMVDEVTHIKEQPVGMIRIGSSFGFGRAYIAPAIMEIMEIYPQLQINFELFDRQIDLNRDNVDLDIRINDDIPDNYIAKLLAKNQRILCASPAYLKQRGMPETLADLQHHDCLVTKERDQTIGVWELENQLCKKSVKISGHLSSNSGEIVLHWGLNGKGIMLRSEWDVSPFLRDGVLVRVLPDYAQSANIWAVYQMPLYSSTKLKVCVEFLSQYCRNMGN